MVSGRLLLKMMDCFVGPSIQIGSGSIAITRSQSLFKLEVVLKPPRRAIHRLREIPAETVEFQILGLMQGKYDEAQSQRFGG